MFVCFYRDAMKTPTLAILITACSLAITTAEPGGRETKDPEAHASKMLKKYGGDDNSLSKEELVKAMQDRPQHGPPPGGEDGAGDSERPPRPEPEEMATKMMEKYDADGDGNLNKAELTKMISERPQGPPHGGGRGEE